TSCSTFNVAVGVAPHLCVGVVNVNTVHNCTVAGFYGVADGNPFINGPIINTNFMLTGGQLSLSNQVSGVLNWVGGNIGGELTVEIGRASCREGVEFERWTVGVLVKRGSRAC